MKKKILVVEDNLLLSEILDKWLVKAGYEVLIAGDEPLARKLIQENNLALILSDVRLPDGDGIKLLEWLMKENRQIPFIVMTEYASFADAVYAVKLGAQDYLSKPVFQEQLLDLLYKILKSPAIVRKDRVIFERGSIKAKGVERLARKVAPSEMSVMILGPNGSGKEFVAHTVHKYSRRRDGPFVAVNCGGIPKELGVSEFFGHVKGAFTGADRNVSGYFESACGGTLFLDEIGNMPYELQTLLLRVLQERTYSPVGSRRIYEADVRIIAATNEDLTKAMSEGRFREDLYYRLAEFEIYQPSLSECSEDILPLANFFCGQYSKELKREITGFTDEAQTVMLTYGWPGNVRELSNRVKRGVLLADAPLLSCEDLGLNRFSIPGGYMSDKVISKMKIEEQEKNSVISVLQTTGGNITRAAKLLGISRRTLYNRMFKYGLK